MDNVCKTVEETEYISLDVYLNHAGHLVNGKVHKSEVLSRAGLKTMFTLLRRCRLRRLGSVCRMEDGQNPKDILYGDLAMPKNDIDRFQLRYSDVCKRDMKAPEIIRELWEDLAAELSGGRRTLTKQIISREEKLHNATEKNERCISQYTEKITNVNSERLAPAPRPVQPRAGMFHWSNLMTSRVLNKYI